MSAPRGSMKPSVPALTWHRNARVRPRPISAPTLISPASGLTERTLTGCTSRRTRRRSCSGPSRSMTWTHARCW
jgi:hypothetical protein